MAVTMRLHRLRHRAATQDNHDCNQQKPDKSR